MKFHRLIGRVKMKTAVKKETVSQIFSQEASGVLFSLSDCVDILDSRPKHTLCMSRISLYYSRINIPKLFSSYKKRFYTNILHLGILSGQLRPAHTWVLTSIFLFMGFSFFAILFPWKAVITNHGRYSIYSSAPLILKDMNYEIYSKDSRAQRVNAIFRDYNCPLEGLGEVFVYEADKYNIPWWLTASMSFQESSCGKMTPEPGGLESYNAWGWGVYGDNVQTFENWVRGVETVSEYMSEMFYSKGVSDLCEIMKTYTPPSQGSWCKGVEHFAQEMQNFESETTDL